MASVGGKGRERSVSRSYPCGGILGWGYCWRQRDLYTKGGESGAGSARRLVDGADSSTILISSAVRP